MAYSHQPRRAYGAVSTISVTSWTALGQQIRRFLGTPVRLRAFNWTMATLLVAMFLPHGRQALCAWLAGAGVLVAAWFAGVQFGRHVRGRSRGGRLASGREAKVAQLDRPAARDEEVGGLDVAVRDGRLAAVKVAERAERVEHEPDDPLFVDLHGRFVEDAV